MYSFGGGRCSLGTNAYLAVLHITLSLSGVTGVSICRSWIHWLIQYHGFPSYCVFRLFSKSFKNPYLLKIVYSNNLFILIGYFEDLNTYSRTHHKLLLHLIKSIGLLYILLHFCSNFLVICCYSLLRIEVFGCQVHSLFQWNILNILVGIWIFIVKIWYIYYIQKLKKNPFK